MLNQLDGLLSVGDSKLGDQPIETSSLPPNNSHPNGDV